MLGAFLWWAPLFKFIFMLSYVLFAPFIGALADAVCKCYFMVWMNALKLLGVLVLLAGMYFMLVFVFVGLGALVYVLVKYGLLTESVPPAALVGCRRVACVWWG